MNNTLPLTKIACFLAAVRLALAPAAFAVIPLLIWASLCSSILAVDPAPDGGYPIENTAEGQDALFSLTNGADVTAIGFQAFYINTGGYDNTGVGAKALFSNTTGFANIALGNDALYANTIGNYNIGIGQMALAGNTTD